MTNTTIAASLPFCTLIEFHQSSSHASHPSFLLSVGGREASQHTYHLNLNWICGFLNWTGGAVDGMAGDEMSWVELRCDACRHVRNIERRLYARIRRWRHAKRRTGDCQTRRNGTSVKEEWQEDDEMEDDDNNRDIIIRRHKMTTTTPQSSSYSTAGAASCALVELSWLE